MSYSRFASSSASTWGRCNGRIRRLRCTCKLTAMGSQWRYCCPSRSDRSDHRLLLRLQLFILLVSCYFQAYLLHQLYLVVHSCPLLDWYPHFSLFKPCRSDIGLSVGSELISSPLPPAQAASFPPLVSGVAIRLRAEGSRFRCNCFRRRPSPLQNLTLNHHTCWSS